MAPRLYRRTVFAYTIGLCGFESMQCKPILLRIYSHTGHIQFGRGTHYPDCDFTSIRYQELFNFFHRAG